MGTAKRAAGLRLLEGARERDVNLNAPLPMARLPEPPEGLSEAVLAVWDDTVRELDMMGVASSADRDALVCFCEAVVLHRRASEVLASSPVLVTGVQGTPIRNAAIAVQRDAATTVRAFARDFGLSPAGRNSVEVNPAPDGENPFA